MEQRDNCDLQGITWDHLRGYGPLNASIEPFEKLTGIRVSWEKRSLKEFGDASLEQLASEYDLIIMDHPHVGVAAYSKCLVPFEEVLDKDILHDFSINSVGPGYESYHYHHQQWALPIDAACHVASYRKDLLQYPFPETWTDVFELAEKLKSQNLYIGMALCPTDCHCSFFTLCAQRGDAPAENKSFLVSEDTGYYALKMLRILYRTCHPDSASWNPINLYDHMATKNEVVYCPLAFGYVNYSKNGYSQNRVQYGPVPGKIGALLGGAGIAVSMRCRNVSMAARYAAWVCGEHFQSQNYVKAGGQPAHKKAWLNEKANEITSHFFSNTLSTIEEAYVRPRTHNWPSFQEKLGEIIHVFLRNDLNIDITWKGITECYNSHLKNE